MRQMLVSIKPRTDTPEGNGFSPACAGGREGRWHRDEQLHSPFIGDLNLEG